MARCCGSTHETLQAAGSKLCSAAVGDGERSLYLNSGDVFLSAAAFYGTWLAVLASIFCHMRCPQLCMGLKSKTSISRARC